MILSLTKINQPACAHQKAKHRIGEAGEAPPAGQASYVDAKSAMTSNPATCYCIWEGKGKEDGSNVEPLSPTWETCVEFQSPECNLAQPWPCHCTHLESKPADEISFFLSFFLSSLPLSLLPSQ